MPTPDRPRHSVRYRPPPRSDDPPRRRLALRTPLSVFDRPHNRHHSRHRGHSPDDSAWPPPFLLMLPPQVSPIWRSRIWRRPASASSSRCGSSARGSRLSQTAIEDLFGYDEQHWQIEIRFRVFEQSTQMKKVLERITNRFGLQTLIDATGFYRPSGPESQSDDLAGGLIVPHLRDSLLTPLPSFYPSETFQSAKHLWAGQLHESYPVKPDHFSTKIFQ